LRFQIVFLLTTLLFLSCSEAPKATEESLRRDLTATWAALKNRDYDALYDHLPPKARETCTRSEFRKIAALARTSLSEEFFEADYMIEVINISDRHAVVSISLISGARLLTQYSERLIWRDGKWYDMSLVEEDYSCAS
jgi:hypothetical protein